jgi:tRNA A37 threonylcarbamoyladenosine synthetase subunit TsaC/SUA5/YrdC
VFGDLVAVYLCEERPLSGAASTVVDLSHADARILRTGGVDRERIGQLLGGRAPLLDSPPPG